MCRSVYDGTSSPKTNVLFVKINIVKELFVVVM